MGLHGQISVYHIMIIITVMFFHTVVTENKQNLKLNSNRPEQIHLSMGSRINDFFIIWATKYNEECDVEYGDDVQTLRISSQQIELKKYSNNAAKFVYRAELLNLVRGSRYSYYIECTTSKTKTEKFSFVVPHNNPKKPHKFVVVADMGLSTKSLPFMIHEILNTGYEVVFHIGDIGYNLDSQEGSIGDQYMKKISNFTASVPYMTTPGDHEKAFEFYHYLNRFSMPNALWPMTENTMWYSIDIGYTHFISINTELLPSSPLSKVQLEWLSSDLMNANKNRKATPWIIVMGHKPMYCTKSVMTQDCDQATSPLRDQFEDLFFEQGVDLYISGHKHCYERSWPMYSGRVFQTNNINPIAPIYIISGTMGYEYIVDKQLSNPFWLAFAASDTDELYARLTVLNETHLIWSLHVVVSNEEADHVQIIQNNHGSFGKAGLSAFAKIQYVESKKSNLPPEPFFLVDVQTENHYRRIILYSTVIILSLVLVAFLRSASIRKALHIRR